MTNKDKKEDHTSLKITASWFTIPRTIRAGLFWSIMILLSIFGWVKIFKG